MGVPGTLMNIHVLGKDSIVCYNLTFPQVAGQSKYRYISGLRF